MKDINEQELNDKVEDLRFLKMEHTEIYKTMIFEAQERVEGRIEQC